MKEMWDIKHRPKNIDEYIFGSSDVDKNNILKFVEDKSFPHLLLYGKPGTGKSSLAYLLKELLEIDDIDFLMRDASKDNGVDIIRNEVGGFVSTVPMGDFKIVFLDECDWLTPAAFATLRGMMVDPEICANARFILACNHIHKVPIEVRSRCTEFKFEALDQEQLLLRSAKILKKEKVTFDLDDLEKFMSDSRYDFRKLLKILQANSVTGKLIYGSTTDANFEVLAESLLHVETGNWDKARTLLAENLVDDDYTDAFRFYYNNFHEIEKLQKDESKFKKAIVILADYMYRHETVADKELNFAACLIKLSEI